MTKTNTSRDVPCPACKAKAGHACRDEARRAKPMAHMERTWAWRAALRKAEARRGPSKGRQSATMVARAAYWRGRSHASDAASSEVHEQNIERAVAEYWRGR